MSRLADVLAPGQYRYRVVGTEVEQLHGGLKFYGRFVHEALPPPIANGVIPVYDACVRERRPVFLENTFLASDRERGRPTRACSFCRCLRMTKRSRWCL